MLKILSDPIINQTIIGSCVQINRSFQLPGFNYASGFVVFDQFAIKSIQNKQNLNFFGKPSTQNLGLTLLRQQDKVKVGIVQKLLS